jgi:hypothetical protein
MRKLALATATAAASILVAAPPAFAIHDPNVPAGVCANSAAAVGIPSTTNPGKVLEHRDLSFSNSVLALRNNADAQCRGPH